MEALAQLGGLVMLDPSDEAARNNFFFGGIEGCRFRKPVVPGDTLVRVCCARCVLHVLRHVCAACTAVALHLDDPQMMRVDLTKFNKRFGIAKMDAKAYVGEDLVCECELTLVMAK